METITITNLSKAYGPKQVLKNISLNIPRGQVLALLGRNGTGKTTLMRILFGLIAPDQGETWIEGISSKLDPVALRLKTGFMSEDCHLYPWMTGSQLEYFLKPLYPTWNHEYFSGLCTMLEVPLQTRVQDMSKGSKRKLMMALALAPKPQALLLDEPLSGLDAVVREQILSTIIHTLSDEGVTILVSSHEILEIERICDRVAIFSQGETILDLASDTLKSSVKRIVATLEAPMDLVPSHPEILFAKTRGAELEIIVKNYTSELEAALLANFKVKDHRCEGLSLQEIFIRMTSGKEE